ncbi:MAG: hypothetical protein ACO3YQ_05715, partial [Flavobacteriales bacterium]
MSSWARALGWVWSGAACCVPFCLAGQTEILDAWLEDWTESGRMDAHEADAIRAHIATAGWPIAPEEIGAVQGLRPATAAAIAADPLWRSWCMAAHPSRTSVSRNRLEARMDTRVTDTLWASSRAGRSGVWALRVDRGGHISGHALLRPTRRPWSVVIGDHTLRWAQGAVTGSVGPFDGLREPQTALRTTIPVAPACSGPAVPLRTGVAAWSERGPWRLAFSAARHPTSWTSPRTAVLVQRIVRFGRVGAACEFGPRNPGSPSAAVAGFHADGGHGNTVWAAEAAVFPTGHLLHGAFLVGRGRELDLFGSISRAHGVHPGKAWGDVRTAVPAPCAAVVGMRWLHPGKDAGRLWIRAHVFPAPDWEVEWRRRVNFPEVVSAGFPWEFRCILRDGGAARLELRRDGPEGVCRIRWDPGAGTSVLLGWRPSAGPVGGDLWCGRATTDVPFYGFEPGALGWNIAPLSARELRYTFRISAQHEPWRFSASLHGTDATSGNRLPRTTAWE